MQLTWRDAVATALVIAMGAVVFAVLGEWGWPLLGTVAAGSGVLLAMGLAACIVGGSDMGQFSMHDPMLADSTILGVLAFVLSIAGMITGSETLFVVFAVTVGVLWLIATLRHALKDERHHASIAV